MPRIPLPWVAEISLGPWGWGGDSFWIRTSSYHWFKIILYIYYIQQKGS